MKLLILALLLGDSFASAAKVEMYTDNTYAVKVKRQKLDCTVHKNKTKSLTFGFKLGGAFVAKVGPEVTFGRGAEMNWNAMSQELIRRYEELCDMHNKGLLTVADFNRRYEKIEEYFDKAKEIKVEVEETVAQRAAKEFDDLDREAKEHREGEITDSAAAKEKISAISKEIAQLSENVKELKSETTRPSEKSDAPAQEAE